MLIISTCGNFCRGIKQHFFKDFGSSNGDLVLRSYISGTSGVSSHYLDTADAGGIVMDEGFAGVRIVEVLGMDAHAQVRC